MWNEILAKIFEEQQKPLRTADLYQLIVPHHPEAHLGKLTDFQKSSLRVTLSLLTKHNTLRTVKHDNIYQFYFPPEWKTNKDLTVINGKKLNRLKRIYE